MKIPVLIQPDYRDTFWCRQMLDGVYTEAARKKYGILPVCFCDDIGEDTLAALPSRLVIVVGTRLLWVTSVLEKLNNRGIGAVLTGYYPENHPAVRGVVSGNIFASMSRHLDYMRKCGRHHIAFYGCSPQASNDESMRLAFLQLSESPDPASCVFPRQSTWEDCYQKFRLCRDRFDAVICVGDLAAVSLQRHLLADGVQLPEDMYITGAGNSRIGAMTYPSITTFYVDSADIARQAVDLYAYLIRQPTGVTATVALPSILCVRESTGGVPEAGDTGSVIPEPDKGGQEDAENDELLYTEAFLGRLDDLDSRLLTCLLHKQTLETAAEELNTSVGTLRYRLRRMLSLTGCPDRQALLAGLTLLTP